MEISTRLIYSNRQLKSTMFFPLPHIISYPPFPPYLNPPPLPSFMFLCPLLCSSVLCPPPLFNPPPPSVICPPFLGRFDALDCSGHPRMPPPTPPQSISRKPTRSSKWPATEEKQCMRSVPNVCLSHSHSTYSTVGQYTPILVLLFV